MIRKSCISEARIIKDIINNFASDGILLPLSLSEVYEHIRDFFVFLNNGHKIDNSSTGYNDIIGVCALHIIWEDLAEIRSLAVRRQYWRKGIGSSLVNACIKEARELGIKRIFSLTFNKEFFTAMGFKEIEKSLLPHKIWADCLKCSKFPDCLETAMIFEF